MIQYLKHGTEYTYYIQYKIIHFYGLQLILNYHYCALKNESHHKETKGKEQIKYMFF